MTFVTQIESKLRVESKNHTNIFTFQRGPATPVNLLQLSTTTNKPTSLDLPILKGCRNEGFTPLK